MFPNFLTDNTDNTDNTVPILANRTYFRIHNFRVISRRLFTYSINPTFHVFQSMLLRWLLVMRRLVVVIWLLLTGCYYLGMFAFVLICSLDSHVRHAPPSFVFA